MPFKKSAITAAVALCAVGSNAGEEITPAQREFFENKIRPVLAENCYQCHNSVDKKKGDIALDYRVALLESDVIVPGDPAKSTLIQAIRHADGFEAMPSKLPKLANLVVDHFEEWIRMGAPDPRLEKPTKAELESQLDWPSIRDKRAAWWSFQPVAQSDPPAADDPAWNGNPIDRFIYSGISENGLQPAPLADPGTLVRRLHLVLTGLPPRPEVVDSFIANPTEDAYSSLVDSLMTSPEYGARWARYWMDWYRYAESHGSEGDPAIPYVTQYRDYLVRAINADVPYDQLIREHLAGDLLKGRRINQELGINESAIGPAHLRMVPHGFGVTDAYDEQITFTDNQVDVISKAMLGVTVSCARCHNHKFDPISQKDFYRFYGIMISSRPGVVNIDSPELQNLHRAELEKLKVEIREQFGTHWLTEIDPAIQRMADAGPGVPENHPFGAWSKWNGGDPAAVQKGIEAMRSAHANAEQHNEKVKAAATYYADLRDQATYDRWFKSGNGLAPKVSPAGSFAVAGEGKNAFTGIYPAGVYSHLHSDKHSALMNSVFHQANGKTAAIRCIGVGSNARFMMRSYPLTNGLLHPAPGLKPEIGWVGLGKYSYWNGEKGYFQINTGADSAVNPKGGRSWFGLIEAYAGDESMRELGAPLAALTGDFGKIKDRESLFNFYKESLRSAVSAWQEGKMTDAQARFLDAFVSHGFLSNEVAKLPAILKTSIETYRKLESEIRIPVRAPGVIEGQPWDQPLLERGDYKSEKEPVDRGFLEIFSNGVYTKGGSGRLELAEDILSKNNTLTARVLVNRLWHHTFGRGIVSSADNFGRLGKEPSHPQLLDHLAADFRENGWSMKRMVRRFVTSRAFRSASTASENNNEKDPENLHLSHFSPRRLDAEAILDTIRFVATNSVPKRAALTPVKRNSLDPFLSTFNLPIPTTTVGVRNLTNVPAQSLVLLNGNITRDAAKQWGQRIKNDRNLGTDMDRIKALFLQAYARKPTPKEIAACLIYLGGEVEDDTAALAAERDKMVALLEKTERGRDTLLAPIRTGLQVEVDKRNEAAVKAEPEPVDLRPAGRWDFEGDAKDAVGGMHGELKGMAKIEGGALVLEGGCLMCAPLPTKLGEKTLEALVQLSSLDQGGGSAMTIQGTDGQVFDGIIYAENEARRWMAGSNHHRRTQSFGGPPEEAAAGRAVRVAIVYQADGTLRCYRDGKPYGNPYKKGAPVSFEKGNSQVIFGLRHGTAPTGRRMLTGKIWEARLYDRALTDEEVAAASSGTLPEVVTDEMLTAALSAPQIQSLARFDEEIARLRVSSGKLERELAERERIRGGGGDAYFRLAHALLNSKELIYVH